MSSQLQKRINYFPMINPTPLMKFPKFQIKQTDHITNKEIKGIFDSISKDGRKHLY